MWELENLHLSCRVPWEITCSCVGNSGERWAWSCYPSVCPSPVFFFNTQIYYYSFASLWVDRNNWEILLSMLDQIQGAPDRSLFWDPWCSHFLLKGAGIFWPLKPALLSRWQSNSFLDFHQALAFGSIYCIKRGKHLRLVEVKSRSFPACHSHPGEAPKELLFYK